MKSSVRLVVSIRLLVCVGCAAAGSPEPVTSPVSQTTGGREAATAPAETPRAEGAGAAVPVLRWFAVAEVEGRGLGVGSGVRFRLDGVDVASGPQGQAMNGECIVEGDGHRCAVAGGELVATAQADGRVSVRQGPLRLVLRTATADEAAAFDAALSGTQAQHDACRSAATCCMDSEEALGAPCDLN